MRLNKTFSIVGIFLAAVAGGMIADTLVDTGPVVCLVDPTCRQLTENEQALLKPIFGDSLPYSDIRIYRRPSLHKLFSEGNIATAHNNNVYLTKDAGPQQADFGLGKDPASGVTVTGDDIFVHEIAHVWQNQTSGGSFSFKELDYYYEIKPNSLFRDFNREQQAEIIRSYFEQRRDIIRDHAQIEALATPDENRRLLKKLLPGKCGNLVTHQRVLEKVLPLEPVTVCSPAPS